MPRAHGHPAALVPEAITGSKCACTSPCLFWYPEPAPPWTRHDNGRLERVVQLLKASKHHTDNGECADFFAMSAPMDHPINRDGRSRDELMVEMFARIEAAYPYLNRTQGTVRHLLLNPCDHGPRDCQFERDTPLTSDVLSDDLHPRSPTRKFAFIELNGVPSLAHFRPGLDIRLPSPMAHECGPACGFRLEDRGGARWAEMVVALSPWSTSRSSATDERTALFAGTRRKHRFFWSGRSSTGVRGDVFRLFGHRRDFLLHDTTGVHNDSRPDLPEMSRTHEFGWMARQMTRADFCYSPTGQAEGDSDRYLPALLYGCVPVFAWSDEEGPYAEIIPWSDVSLRVEPANLAQVIDAVSDAQLARMRRAMQSVWHRLVFPEGVDGSDGHHLSQMMLSLGAHAATTQPPADGVHTFFEVLAARMRGEKAEAEDEAKVVEVAVPEWQTTRLLAAGADPFTVTDATLSPETPAALQTKVLKNERTGEYVQVAVGSGGTTLRLQLVSPATGKLRDVLVPLTAWTDAAGIRDTTGTTHFAGSILAPFANRVANGTYDFSGSRYNLVRNECSEARCNALHGFLYNRSMEAVAQEVYSTNSASGARLTLGYRFDGTTTPGWPFKAAVNVTYALETSGARTTLSITTRALNMQTDGGALPWTVGWHPYFLVSDVSTARVELDVSSGGTWQHVVCPAGAPRDGSLIPTGEMTPWTVFDGSTPLGGTPTAPTYMDDEYKLIRPEHTEGANVVNRIHDGNETTVLTGYNSSFRTWQIFTGSKELFGWDAVVLEPMSGLADAFNSGDGLTVLKAGQVFEGTFAMHME